MDEQELNTVVVAPLAVALLDSSPSSEGTFSAIAFATVTAEVVAGRTGLQQETSSSSPIVGAHHGISNVTTTATRRIGSSRTGVASPPAVS